MSSPERMEMLAAAVARLVQAMRIMDANQTDRDQVLSDHDVKMEEHEARFRELSASSRAAFERIEGNRARIRELLDLVTEMRADIARLDAAS